MKANHLRPAYLFFVFFKRAEEDVACLTVRELKQILIVIFYTNFFFINFGSVVLPDLTLDRLAVLQVGVA